MGALSRGYIRYKHSPSGYAFGSHAYNNNYYYCIQTSGVVNNYYLIIFIILPDWSNYYGVPFVSKLNIKVAFSFSVGIYGIHMGI